MLPQIDQSNNLEPQVPLETGTFISDLVTSNPAPSDPLSNADDHVRLVKATIKATFPNITGAITSTNAAIDAAVTATNTNGVAKLADAGSFFKTNTTDGFTNPASGEIDLKLAGTIAARFLNSSGVLSLVLPGALTVTNAITGPGIVPVGGMIMWLSDTLPATSSGAWCWANGGVLARTGNGAALWTLWGNTSVYGLGDGVTTFNVIDMCEASPVGKSGMGGASSPGLLNSISSGLKGVLGGLFGSDTNTLSNANLPPYTPVGTITNGAITFPNTSDTSSSGGSFGGVTTGPGGTSTDMTPLLRPAQATSTFAGTPAPGRTNTPVNNVGPLRVCNFIIRIG